MQEVMVLCRPGEQNSQGHHRGSPVLERRAAPAQSWMNGPEDRNGLPVCACVCSRAHADYGAIKTGRQLGHKHGGTAAKLM